jgi:hypothetical protein
MTSLLRRARIATAALLPILAACGSETTEPGGGGPSTSAFSATVEGRAWDASGGSVTATPGGIFVMTGVEVTTSLALSMTLYHIGAPGTYPLGVGGSVPGGLAQVVAGSSGWSTPLSGAAGSVTITAVSPTRIAGTFSFVAAGATPGLTSTRTVTAGSFNLPVVGPSTLVVADNAGGKVSGTLNGTAFNASSVASVAAPTGGVLTFAGANLGQTVTVLVSEYTGVGTYTLGSGASRSIRLTNTTAPTGTWGGTNATTTGSVTVTSATTTRVRGTFTATLQQVVGTGPPVTVTGTFDLGI